MIDQKYIISESELEMHYLDWFDKDKRKEILKDFLKDKQPVECVAEGKNTSTFIVIAGIANGRVVIDKNYTGKSIKIYVEVKQ